MDLYNNNRCFYKSAVNKFISLNLVAVYQTYNRIVELERYSSIYCIEQ